MLKSILKLGGNSDGSKKNESPEKKVPQLPPNFSDEVFNLELEVEKANVDISVINRLVELYAVAIEYYESIQSDKYQIFKNKTRSLLLKNNVSIAMDIAHEKLISEPNEEYQSDQKGIKFELNNDENNLKQRQKELELNFKYIQQQDTTESVKTLMNSHNSDIKYNKRIIQKDTDFQKNLILKRLHQRKVKKHGENYAYTEGCEMGSHFDGQFRSSYELGSKSDLDMDMVDITLPAKTEPSSSFNDNQQDRNKGFNKDFASHNNYESMIQQQLDSKNQVSFLDPFNPDVTHTEGEVIDLFRGQSSSSGKKTKKKKVRVSQKSVMEFQLQNSVIPF